MVNKFVKRLNSGLIELMPDRVISRLGEKYIAGHSLEEGITYMHQRWMNDRVMTTFDILGEDSHTVEEADEKMQAYLKAIQMIQALSVPCGYHYHDRPFSISVKPSSICVVNEIPEQDMVQVSKETPLLRRLQELLKAAEDIPLTLDREDHRYTALSLQAEILVRQQGYYHFGGVSQSMLDRTEMDLKSSYRWTKYPFPKDWKRNRMCIGIYDEPEEIAVQKKKEMKERLYRDVSLAFELGIYPEIATHDLKLIKSIVEDLVKPHSREGRCEFQVLKGPAVVKEIEAYLKEEGLALREYAPVEIHSGDGFPYMHRRLKANPRLVRNGMADMLYQLVH